MQQYQEGWTRMGPYCRYQLPELGQLLQLQQRPLLIDSLKQMWSLGHGDLGPRL